MREKTKKIGTRCARLRQAGHSWVAIGAKLKCKPAMARYMAHQVADEELLSQFERRREKLVAVKSLKNAGVRPDEIAKKLNMGRASVYSMLSGKSVKDLAEKQALSPMSSKLKAEARRRCAFELRNQGKEWDEIAASMHITTDAAQALAHRYVRLTGQKLKQPSRSFDLNTNRERVQSILCQDLDRQKRAFELRSSGMSWKDLASELGTNIPGATSMVRAFKRERYAAAKALAREQSRRRSTRERQLRASRKLRAQGKTWAAIGEELGVPPTTVRCYLHKKSDT